MNMPNDIASSSISRRDLLSSLGVAGAGAALAAGPALNASEAFAQEDAAFETTVAWDAEYDVVICGFGFGGMVSAITAAEAGARVLVVEKCDAKHYGGNSRICMQQILTITDGHRDEGLEYLKSIRGSFDTPSDEMLEMFADALYENEEWIAAHGGTLAPCMPGSGEFKTIPGHEYMDQCSLNGTHWDGALFHLYEDIISEMDDITVWYETPARHFIQDPATKIVHGVQVEHDGQAYNVRALNGVILATGGFESNMQMIQDFQQLPYCYPKGGTFNTGDGIKMAQEIGANLWHMSNSAGPDFDIINEETGRCVWFGFAGRASAPNHSYHFCADNSAILVGADGTRFYDESVFGGHGFIDLHGRHMHIPMPLPVYCVFDDKALSHVIYPLWEDNQAKVDDGTITKADTLGELAEKLGLPDGSLDATIARYNDYCASGEDVEFGRAVEDLVAFDNDGPFYGFEVRPCYTNTMGGPQRSITGHIVDVNGEEIPHLYEAGECGDIYADVYQGAGNVASCHVFGRISGAGAAQEKDDNLRASVMEGKQAVDFSIKQEPFDAGTLADNEYVGRGRGIGGWLTAKVTLDGEKIVGVEILDENETPGIGSYAVEKMPARILEAGSVDVDVVAGATCSSYAIIGAVAEALASASER